MTWQPDLLSLVARTGIGGAFGFAREAPTKHRRTIPIQHLLISIKRSNDA